MQFEISARTNGKRLGIIGGMGSHASSWLLQRIIDLCNVSRDQDYPEIILHSNSAIPDRTRAIVHNECSPLPELRRSVAVLNNAGAEIAVIACMTAHYYYQELSQLFHGEMVNVIDLIKEELQFNIQYRYSRKLGLIGSTGLLRTGIIQQQLLPAGYEVITLDEEEQEMYFMQPMYMEGGIKSGGTDEALCKRFGVQKHILAGRGAEVIIGACSEVPLMLPDDSKLPLLNVFDLTAVKIVAYCYQ